VHAQDLIDRLDIFRRYVFVPLCIPLCVCVCVCFFVYVRACMPVGGPAE